MLFIQSSKKTSAIPGISKPLSHASFTAKAISAIARGDAERCAARIFIATPAVNGICRFAICLKMRPLACSISLNEETLSRIAASPQSGNTENALVVKSRKESNRLGKYCNDGVVGIFISPKYSSL